MGEDSRWGLCSFPIVFPSAFLAVLYSSSRYLSENQGKKDLQMSRVPKCGVRLLYPTTATRGQSETYQEPHLNSVSRRPGYAHTISQKREALHSRNVTRSCSHQILFLALTPSCLSASSGPPPGDACSPLHLPGLQRHGYRYVAPPPESDSLRGCRSSDLEFLPRRLRRRGLDELRF